MEILDMKCAKYGSEIASASGNDETLITKALGVLQEDGVYAFFLYLASQKKEPSNAIKEKAFIFLRQDEILRQIFKTDNDTLKAIRDDLSDKLDELLFAKELLERTLVYARYHAKALDNPKAEEIADKEGA